MRYARLFAALLIVAMAATAWGASIRDRAEYRPSSDLTLGTYDAAKGYQMPDEFQLNLEYQGAIPDSEIEAFDDYFLDKTPPELNFPDGERYYLQVNCAGELPIGIWEYRTSPYEQYYAPDSGASWVQWTISYWSGSFLHTILAGDIINPGGPDTYLRVRPTGGFRTFVGDGTANYVEVFDGETVFCEVLGYGSPVSCDDLVGGGAGGSVVEAHRVPEPLTVLSALGGIGALAGYVRRRRAG
jgi:hypothetical protein